MRAFGFGVLFLCVAGCDAALYGTGTAYLFNGTDGSAEISLDGRTPREVSLRPGAGELLVGLVAGPYQVSIKQAGAFPQIMATEFMRDRLTLVNVGAAACFARADILGMYSQHRSPVKVSQIYKGELISSIREEISVFPGERVPESRPRSAEVFLRVDVVPCDLLNDESKIAELLYRRR